MFERILIRLREKVRKNEYVVTAHARKEMNDEDLSVFDLESGILTGEILERQKDRVTAEWKYRVKGKTIAGDEIELIAKFSPTGKLVIITVYEP
ncbi:DUF4258 domain-containing protein [candidate division KSB1 bacterium]|nr:DUF4258 domain-containing protein [candidate division KSB1 bacterium]NIR69821.1 DUF4258 domain-containing protein [candidate division KSB1 bacterium]NIS24368.1 DUF4258 domain-containing protein [candidate division KSB1 bacterium]NIT71304.1 DUF4258 domain-containing protein [candidate division KSB1 bacterium]NIU27599.1 DUF4258 domain-containing protein [candidate division KSB1 bacterium]